MEIEEIAEEIFALMKRAQGLVESRTQSEIDAEPLHKTMQETLVREEANSVQQDRRSNSPSREKTPYCGEAKWVRTHSTGPKSETCMGSLSEKFYRETIRRKLSDLTFA